MKGSRGVDLILVERLRQMAPKPNGEGYDADHDDELHAEGQLAGAANAYLQLVVLARPDPDRIRDFYWPWLAREWHPSDDPIRNLVKAGALIAAEIDRRIRAGE